VEFIIGRLWRQTDGTVGLPSIDGAAEVAKLAKGAG
jgi:hypothetical protein